MACLLGMLLAFALAPRSAAADDGDGVLLALEGPGTPYGRVEFEARLRGQTVRIRHTQLFGEAFEPHEKIGLATPDELDALWTRLDALGAFALRAPAGRPTAAATPKIRYALRLRRAGAEHAFEVDSPELLTDRRYVEAILGVRAFCVGVAGEIVFREGRVPRTEGGLLTVDAKPPSRVFLDELLLASSTPVDGVRVTAGQHEVRLVSLDGRATRVFPVTVERGKTTALRVVLE